MKDEELVTIIHLGREWLVHKNVCFPGKQGERGHKRGEGMKGERVNGDSKGL